jgi:hypothetical protein
VNLHESKVLLSLALGVLALADHRLGVGSHVPRANFSGYSTHPTSASWCVYRVERAVQRPVIVFWSQRSKIPWWPFNPAKTSTPAVFERDRAFTIWVVSQPGSWGFKPAGTVGHL